MSKFVSYPGAFFSVGDVESYLQKLADIGWSVFSHSHHHGEYIVQVDENRRIEIRHHIRDNEWSIYSSSMPNELPFDRDTITTFNQFEDSMTEAVQYLGETLTSGPKTIRLQDKTPASNKVSITRMTNNKPVKGIFDPYFDDKAIANLITFRNLGMEFEPSVQILTTYKMKNRISTSLVIEFGVETSKNLDIRYCVSDREHRRFLLLSTGESLVIGCSLNSLGKNEAASIESSHFDREFFAKQWESAQVFER